MKNDSRYLKGILITFMGVLVLSSDALLIRMSNVAGFRAAFWRGLFTFLSVSIIFLANNKKEAVTIVRTQYKRMLFPGLLWGISGVAFAIGVHNSGASIALVMLSLGPFFASLHAYLFYKQKPHPLTLLAALGAGGGIIYMFSTQLGTLEAKDFLYNIWSPLLYGTNLSYLRQNPTVNRQGISILGGFTAMILALIISRFQVIIPFENLLPLLVLGAIVIPFAQLSIGHGTRFIPAPESALISSLETIIGIIYVWIFLSEVPSLNTIIGGAIVFACIVFNTLAQAYWVKR
ncbi:MAG: DMT family transporter [Spirochaetales bacterium]|nr:DMT family transporter [Spirochaetales bacterium]